MEIGVVGSEDQVEVDKVRRAELARTEVRNIDAAPPRFGHRAAVGGMADMPVARARRIERRFDPRSGEGGARSALGEGRAADIAEAEEQDSGFPNVAVLVHIILLCAQS